MYCICCKKNRPSPHNPKGCFSIGKVSSKEEEEDILWKNSKRGDGSLYNVNNKMIDNGIIWIIEAGYGSTHDGDQFVIAICDDCIEENLEDATLLYYGNYMFQTMNSGDWSVEKEKEKSKQKYRRRRNLDGLV